MELGAVELQAYLTYLATHRRVSASTQNQALAALLFLYKKVLHIDLPWMDKIVRAKRPMRVPIVMTRTEVRKVLDILHSRNWLAASILYGSGIRLIECLRLRIQDIDFEYLQVSIPFAIDRKYVNAPKEWSWQYVLPSEKYAYVDFHRQKRRHFMHPSGVQRAVKLAVIKAGINKHASCHTFRHSFATHVLKRGGLAVLSPLDITRHPFSA